MPVPVRMPKLGMTMSEGSIAAWIVEEGDSVRKGQVIAEIETDKTVIDLEAPANGILSGFCLEEGDTVSVAEPIAWILCEGETVDDIPEEGARDDVGLSEKDLLRIPIGAKTPSGQSSTKTGRLLSSPAVRRTATELGVDLNLTIGTGPDGRIVKEDVVREAAQAAGDGQQKNQPSTLVPWSAGRQAIIRRVNESAAIPQIVLYSQADASSLVALRKRDATIAYDDAVAFCVARSLQDHKYLNASYGQHGITIHAHVDIGLAVAIEHGLLIPVIRGADTQTLRQISVQRHLLVQKVRSKTVTRDETAGGTFTLTNLGMFPVDRFTALINPPQVAILSIGRIRSTASPAENGGLVFRPIIEFGLTLDHRVVDGEAGARFLQDFIARIESIQPEGDEDE